MSGKFYTSGFYKFFSCFSTVFKTIVRNIQGSKFEPEVSVLGRFVGKGSICIDVGGAYGRYAYPLSKLVGSEGRIYSFEPGDYSHYVLSSVVRLHGLKNVTVIKKGLAGQKGSMKLLSPVKRSGKVGPSLAYISEHEVQDTVSEEVELTSIDDFVREQGLSKVDFIKCDTEGAEYLVFSGAKATLEKFRPAVLAEVDKGNLKRFGTTPRDLGNIFAGLGYLTYSLKDGKLVRNDSFEREANYFFIHPSSPETPPKIMAERKAK